MSNEHKKRFYDFGKLRNRVVHLGAEEGGIDGNDVLQFIFEVVDYICQDIYEKTFVEYAAEWDEVIITEGYLINQIVENKIKVHPETLKLIKSKVSD